MKASPFRLLVATSALLAGAFVFAGVTAVPSAERPALGVWRAGALPTEVVAGPGPAGAAGVLSYLKASNAEAADAFGSSVALSRDGLTLVVGADLKAGRDPADGAQDPAGLSGAGAVYVYARTASGWVQQASLQAPQPQAGAGFGLAVGVSDDGRTVVVGAPFEAHAQGEGTVHVFKRAGDAWHAPFSLRPLAGGQAGLFGTRIAIAGDGSTVAVGAVEGEATSARGTVHLFAWRDGQWSPASRLEAAKPMAGDGFGQSLAFSVDGRTLAVGARPAPASGIVPALAPAVMSGAVHVFAQGAGGWEPVARMLAADAAPGPLAATEVALSADGQRLVVGLGSTGKAVSVVRVYDRHAKGWVQSASLQSAGASWGFGERLALSADGRRLAVSAMYEPLQSVTGAGQAEAGAVYLFSEQASGQWTQTERLHAARGRGGDLFGSAVALSGDGRWLATGARLEDGGARGVDAGLPATPAANSGAVYVYAPA